MVKFLLLKRGLRKIIFFAACIQMLCTTMAFAQQVSGKVTSLGDGQGIPGVNIIVQGTTTGTVTDADGNYRLNDIPGESVLVFSSIGYASEEVAVNKSEEHTS